MKKILLLIFAFALCLFVGVSGVKAQESSAESQVKKYQITFPIADLGNCGSYSECKAYCSDVTHKDECTAFAKKKGFYREPKVKTEIIEAAKEALGCDSQESCKAVCQDPANKDKCEAFAKAHSLGQRRGGDPSVLEKAKNILGCDSEASCKAFCQSEENKQKCAQFAKSAGIGGGERKVGPGGCGTETECRTYCESHKDECIKFSQEHQKQQEINKNKSPLPGGCGDAECAKNFCRENKAECPTVLREMKDAGSQGKTNMEELCRQNVEKCQKMDTKNFLKDIRNTFQGGEQKEGPNTAPNVHGASTFSFFNSIRGWLGI